MLKPGKVATPAMAAFDCPPESVPPPALVPIATDTLLAKLVTVLLNASCTVTLTAGLMFANAVTVVGCTENATCAAAPGVMLNAADCADVSALADACSL